MISFFIACSIFLVQTFFSTKTDSELGTGFDFSFLSLMCFPVAGKMVTCEMISSKVSVACNSILKYYYTDEPIGSKVEYSYVYYHDECVPLNGSKNQFL